MKIVGISSSRPHILSITDQYLIYYTDISKHFISPTMMIILKVTGDSFAIS